MIIQSKKYMFKLTIERGSTIYTFYQQYKSIKEIEEDYDMWLVNCLKIAYNEHHPYTNEEASKMEETIFIPFIERTIKINPISSTKEITNYLKKLRKERKRPLWRIKTL